MRYEVILHQRELTDEELRARFDYFFGEGRDEAAMLADVRRTYGRAYDRAEAVTDDEAIAREAHAKLAARAAGDPTVSVEMRVADVRPVHTGGRWCFWSDGRVTQGLLSWRPSRALTLDPPRGLSPDAARLVQEVVASDSGEPAPGWRCLTEVARIVTRETVARLPRRRGQVNAPTLERLAVETTSGGAGELWLWCDGHGEDYLLEVAETRAAVEAVALERVVEDDAVSLRGMVDVHPETHAAAVAAQALGRDPTPEEAARAVTLWRAAWRP